MSKTLTKASKVQRKKYQVKRDAIRKEQRLLEKQTTIISTENAKMINFIPIGVSPIRVALKFAKTNGTTGFLPARLSYLNPSMFHCKDQITETIAILCRHKFLKKCENEKYAITARGIRGVSLIVQREPSRNAYSLSEED